MKIAYLTIDDAPSENFKEKVDFLLENKIPAIWFCRGDRMQKSPDVIIYAIKKGFIIGNHSFSHPHFSDMTLEECYEQIRKTDEIIEELYKKAGIKRPTKLFRFPYGDKGGNKNWEGYENEKPYSKEGKEKKDKIQTFLRRLGYTQPKFPRITYKYYRKASLLDDVDCYWTYDVMEWTIFRTHLFGIDSLEKVFERMEKDVPEGWRGLNYPDSEDIILVHDYAESTNIFKPIIERLLAKGIVFKMPKFYKERKER